jgi:glutamine amidotransferase
MRRLAPYIKGLRVAAEGGKIIFGICLGLQLFFSESKEGGSVRGLGLVEGRVTRLPENVKIPQMGWNTIKIVEKSHPLLEGIKDDAYFYFVHSYYGTPSDPASTLALTDYGVNFPSIIAKDNVLGTQFHPEKSGAAGLRMLRNLVGLIRS